MTARVEHLSAAGLTALADGDLAAAAAYTSTMLTPWLVAPGNLGTWRRRAAQVLAQPEDLAWVTGLLVDDGIAVGRAGFHAAPDPSGMVELGYAVHPAHRRSGHARAALDSAIVRAQDDRSVRVLRVTISPDNLPSLGLVEQYPFVRNGEQWDDEDGLELIYELAVTRR